ncbi:MAG TPA: efflux RND transporter periplasmic adaptor subunit [Terriglobales bacterium]
MHKRNHIPERRPLVGVIVVVGVAVLLFSGWMRFRNGAVAVRAEKVVPEDIANVIATNGKIEPLHNFESHAPAPATVKRVLVREGDHVKAGQLLLELDDADAKAQAARAWAQLRAAEAAQYAAKEGGTNEEVLTTRTDLIKARAERDNARRNVEAVERLQTSGAASPAEVQAAEDRMKKAEADVQLLESKLNSRFSSPEVEKVEAAAAQARAAYAAAQDLLNSTTVHAGTAGSVYQLPVKQGSYVTSGELLVQVANLEKIAVRAFVDEPEIGRLAQGQKVEIRWDAIPGRVWEGVLTTLPTVVSSIGTRTVGEITCEIANPDGKLLPNVNVNVSIITAHHGDALTVARESVREVDGKRFVYVIADDKLRSQEVQTGISSLTRVEILRGLNAGQVIAKGAVNGQPLHGGLDVKVVDR